MGMDEQQALGQPYELEWRGRQLRFSGIVDGIIAKCVAAAKLAAIQERDENIALLYASPDPTTQEELAAYKREFAEDMVTGRWKWGGALQEKWRRSQDGLFVFIGALLEEGGTPLTRAEIQQLASEKQKELFAIIALAEWDISNPNLPRPAVMMELLAVLSKSKSATQSSAKNGT